MGSPMIRECTQHGKGTALFIEGPKPRRFLRTSRGPIQLLVSSTALGGSHRDPVFTVRRIPISMQKAAPYAVNWQGSKQSAFGRGSNIGSILDRFLYSSSSVTAGNLPIEDAARRLTNRTIRDQLSRHLFGV